MPEAKDERSESFAGGRPEVPRSGTSRKVVPSTVVPSSVMDNTVTDIRSVAHQTRITVLFTTPHDKRRVISH